MGRLLYTEYFIYIKLFMLKTASSGRAIKLLTNEELEAQEG